MADEQNTVGGQTPPASDTNLSAAGGQTPPTQRTTGGQTPPAPTVDDDDPPISLSEARRMRREAQENRALIKELQTFKEQAERASLSELEKAQKDLAKHQQTATEWQQKYQELLVKTAIKDQALALHFHDPEDAFVYLMRSGELDFDADGHPKNAEKLLKALAEAKPYLVKAAEQSGRTSQPSIGASNPSRAAAGAQPITNPRSLTWNDVLKRPQ